MRTPLLAALVCLAGPALAGPPSPGFLKKMVGGGHPKEVTDALETAGNLGGTHGDAVLHKVISGAPGAFSSYSAGALIRGMQSNDTRYKAAGEYVFQNATDLSVREVKQLAQAIEPEISPSLRASMNIVRRNQIYESNAHMAGVVLGDTLGRRVARDIELRVKTDLALADREAAQRRDNVLELYAKGRPMSAKELSELALEAETPTTRFFLQGLAVKAQK
jgi:hypothetical protein